MADEEDDFTFPTTAANLPPCFFESPPLWRPAPRLKNDEVEEAGRFELCSCEACRAMNKNISTSLWYVDNDDDEIIREEKMDLLWEDLDEKFSRNNNYGKLGEDDDENSSSHVKICCVKALKLSKQNGNAINGLKASFLELISFLMKKGFSMHNSGNSIKKIAW